MVCGAHIIEGSSFVDSLSLFKIHMVLKVSAKKSGITNLSEQV